MKTHEDSVVETELRRWGFWVGIQYAADGYSPMNALTQILSGRADRPEHRILCVDPPDKFKDGTRIPHPFWEINSRVLMMRREFYEVLVAKYALPCKVDGHPYRITDLAVFLGLRPECFLDRLARARAGYKRLIFTDLALANSVC